MIAIMLRLLFALRMDTWGLVCCMLVVGDLVAVSRQGCLGLVKLWFIDCALL